MAARFCVLGSGSSGNAGVLECDGAAILVDAGLGPRQIAGRLKTAGLAWPDIKAAVLTHTHGDHWNELTLGHLFKYRVPIFCHAVHAEFLVAESLAAQAFQLAGLMRTYRSREWLAITASVRGLPLPLSHDCE